MPQIIETNFAFKTLSKRKRTETIVLHHSASSDIGAEQIHRQHLNQGWAGIGYHYLVSKDGKIYRGRPQWAIGAHCSGCNSATIGICFEGNFEKEKMSEKQIQTGIELVQYLKELFKIKKVVGHRDMMATVCPGKNFPIEKMKGA